MISLVLSGGVGSRLWPLSREKYPKQFLALFELPLFVKTLKRLSSLGEVQVCTSASLKSLTETAIHKSSLQVGQRYYEPMGRNTAPAIALACLHMQRQNRVDEIMGVFPSDHWIQKEDQFRKVLNLAQECAQQGQIVTIGIQASYPATGFGYIECYQDVFAKAGDLQAFQVKGFTEKPSFEKAQKYIQAGNYFWNSGMFVFSVKTMIACFEQFMPEMWHLLNELDPAMNNIEKVYATLPSQSVDYGVMEHAKNQVNIPCDIGWNDLGSWDDVAQLTELHGGTSEAEVFNFEAKNNFAYSNQNKAICFSGVDNLIVVDTGDALLITQKGKSQKTKDLYDIIKKQKSNLVAEHIFDHRPWGFYQNLLEEADFKTKIINVDPGQQLSYQSHTKRSEIWITVMGHGEVVLDDTVLPVSPGKVVTVPVGSKHRMRNTGVDPLRFIEVQLGEYFGEDDIVRYQDDYKRL